MATITEDYCSQEVYRLLREKGFDGEIHTTFDKEGYTQVSITLQMAMKWLREVYNIDISIIPLRSHKEYLPRIESDTISHDAIPCRKYEDACEAAIKYCLDNLDYLI